MRSILGKFFGKCVYLIGYLVSKHNNFGFLATTINLDFNLYFLSPPNFKYSIKTNKDFYCFSIDGHSHNISGMMLVFEI